MTDKEQIIIDGVDVSKCRYFRPGSALTCSRMYGGACDNKYSNELCYFKQLAHKTRECEELEKENIDLETGVINSLGRNILQDSCYDEDENCPDNSDLIAFMDFVIKSCIDDFVVNIDNLEKENARKTRECEELEKENKKIEEDWNSIANRNLDLEMENAKLREELSEIKDEKLDLKNTCYRKALEEIEGLATNLRTRTDYHSEDEVNADIDNVLNIINKAKEKENAR